MVATGSLVAPPAQADSYEPVSGSGSTWIQDAMSRWQRDVAVDYGMRVVYAGSGADAGRRDFIDQSVDFAVSELPFRSETTPDDPQSETGATPFTYIPIVGGGTALAFHLEIDGRRVTELRLSGDAVAGIFAGRISRWNDPAIQSDNPSLVLPDRAITPVYRAEGSSASADFTAWMADRHPDIWTAGASVHFPPANGSFLGQSGALGVAGYVSQSYGEGAIAYVENAYALKTGLPVAKVLNDAGYFVEPTAASVSIALLSATSAEDGMLDLEAVHRSADPRAYPISSVSYMIAPTASTKTFTVDKGGTLSRFVGYVACEGQRLPAELGYAPLPINVVRAVAQARARIPGSPGSFNPLTCNNPTYGPGDTVVDNALLRDTPLPPPDDKRGGHVGGSDLTEGLRTLSIELLDGGPIVRLVDSAERQGATLRVGVGAPGTMIGRVTLDVSGSAVITLPTTLTPGSVVALHLSQSDGTVVAWNRLSIPAEGFPRRAEGNLSAKVAASDLFQLTAASVATAVDFGALHADTTSAARMLGRLTVVDDRFALTGWTMSVAVAEFEEETDPSRTMPAGIVGYAPTGVDVPAGVSVGAAQIAGSATYPAVLASGDAGTSTTAAGASFDTAITVRAPRGTPSGTYHSTLTLTLIAR